METTLGFCLTKAVVPTSLYHYIHSNVLWNHLSPRWVLAAGAGAGLDRDSPGFRLMSGARFTY